LARFLVRPQARFAAKEAVEKKAVEAARYVGQEKNKRRIRG
jgi:hypothetical protein